MLNAILSVARTTQYWILDHMPQWVFDWIKEEEEEILAYSKLRTSNMWIIYIPKGKKTISYTMTL